MTLAPLHDNRSFTDWNQARLNIYAFNDSRGLTHVQPFLGR